MGASDKKYNLEIELCVTFPIGYSYEAEYLVQQIFVADSMNPWISYHAGGEPAKSIHWWSSPEIREGDGVDRLYVVRLRPLMLGSFAHAAAYEKYGENLAHNLVQLLPSRLISVQSRLILNGTFGERHRHSNGVETINAKESV